MTNTGTRTGDFVRARFDCLVFSNCLGNGDYGLWSQFFGYWFLILLANAILYTAFWILLLVFHAKTGFFWMTREQESPMESMVEEG
jgi:hypothetical protein